MWLSIFDIFITQVIHSKLVMKSDFDAPCRSIKSAILFDGSITDFDSRLCGFDLATCLEVFRTNPFSEPLHAKTLVINAIPLIC